MKTYELPGGVRVEAHGADLTPLGAARVYLVGGCELYVHPRLFEREEIGDGAEDDEV